MARYYRRRYRTIVRAPKKKWASNIKNTFIQTSGDATKQFGVVALVQNSTDSTYPTPVILKTGNVKVQGDYRVVTSSTGGHAEVSLYVVFIPEGTSLTTAVEAEQVIQNHPEWIMAWRYLGDNQTSSASAENNDRFSFSSRMKRNLNSGDSVRMLCIVNGYAVTSVSVNFTAQYWTCAN